VAADDSLAQLHQFYDVQKSNNAPCASRACKQNTLAYKPPFTNAELDAWIADIYANGGKAGLNWPAINKYATHYWDAVKAGYGSNIDSYTITSPDGIMLQHLMDNVYQFSAAKNFTHLQQLTRLINDNGKIREWKSFKTEAQKLNLLFNKTWLKTEYDLALAGSTMASKWVQFSSTGDRTMLRYQTIGDARVRAEHAQLNGITLPIDHSFWNTHYPPNGFKCRCDVERVPYSAPQTDDAGITPITNDSVPPLFRTNLAKDKLVFPKGHAYFKGEIAIIQDNLLPNAGAYYVQSPTNKNVWISNEVVMPSKKNDERHLLDVEIKKEIGHLLQQHFNSISFVAPELNIADWRYKKYFVDIPIANKVPDNFCNKWWEVESHEAMPAKKSHFTKMLKSGVEQSPNVIVYIKKTDFTIDVITTHIQKEWKDNPNLKELKTVLIKMPNENKLIEIKKATVK
jgi:SPP1 gp7 family putative phage head morphogenesis protein